MIEVNLQNQKHVKEKVTVDIPQPKEVEAPKSAEVKEPLKPNTHEQVMKLVDSIKNKDPELLESMMDLFKNLLLTGDHNKSKEEVKQSKE